MILNYASWTFAGWAVISWQSRTAGCLEGQKLCDVLKQNWCFSFIPLPSAPSACPSVLLYLFFLPSLNVVQAKCWLGLKCCSNVILLIVLFLSTYFHLFLWLEVCFGQNSFSPSFCVRDVSSPRVLVNVGSSQTDCQSVPWPTVWTGQGCFSVQQAKFSSRVIFRFARQAMCLLSHHFAVCSSPLISFFSKLAKTFQPIRMTADFGTHHINWLRWANSSLKSHVLIFSPLFYPACLLTDPTGSVGVKQIWHLVCKKFIVFCNSTVYKSQRTKTLLLMKNTKQLSLEPNWTIIMGLAFFMIFFYLRYWIQNHQLICNACFVWEEIHVHS